MSDLLLIPVRASRVKIGDVIARSKGSVLNIEFLPVKQIRHTKFINGETIDFVFSGHIGCGVSADQIVLKLDESRNTCAGGDNAEGSDSRPTVREDS